MRYLRAFNGKTFHDGTNRWSISKLPVSTVGDVQVVKMANGVLFDPDYGTGSQTAPEPFSASFFMRFSTKAAAEAEEAAIKALIGTNGTATADLDSGGTSETCNASLKSINLVRKNSDFAFVVTLNMIPFDDWS